MNAESPIGNASSSIPVVSVVIPVHNYARYVPEAIASVQAQTLQAWECVVVDDGSTDDTPEVLARLSALDDRITVVRQAQRGLSAARNHGLQASRGRYVQFLDADDLLHEGKLEVHVKALEARPDVDIVFGPTSYFDDGEPAVLRSALRKSDGPVPAPMSGSGAEMLPSLLARNQMTVCAPLVRRSVLDEVGVFDEQLKRLEDWQFWLRCAISGMRFLFMPSIAPVALIRVHRGSLSTPVVPMLVAEVEMRRQMRPKLTARQLLEFNERLLDEALAELGKLLALDGAVLPGLHYLAAAAISGRRPRQLAWVLAILLLPVPGVRELIWRRRSRGRRHPGSGTLTGPSATKGFFRASTVIVHYGEPATTLRVLHRLARSIAPMSIVVVDNSGELDPPPGVSYLRMPANLGFAGGANVGAKYALAQGADLVWFLNNDTEPEPDALERLLETVASCRPACIVGSWEVDPLATQMWNPSNFQMPALPASLRNRVRVVRCPLSTVDFVSGFSMIVSRPVFELIGFLDETFFHYCEDVDYSLRGLQQGIEVVLDGDSQIRHLRSSTLGRGSQLVAYYFFRNRLTLVARYRRLHPLLAVLVSDPRRTLLPLFSLRLMIRRHWPWLVGSWLGTIDAIRRRSGPAATPAPRPRDGA